MFAPRQRAEKCIISAPFDVTAAMRQFHSQPDVAVIGAGPAGLMAAEVMAQAGLQVTVYDAMPSAGRKLLRAGIGGLNLTHAEEQAAFVSRYGERQAVVAPWLATFGPEALRGWVHGLGIDTYVGSSRRVFPVGNKAAPLLRAWLKRLRASGVTLQMRWRWQGWQDGALLFHSPDGPQQVQPRATVLALGGASWPQLGSDGHWVEPLQQQGVAVAALRPANCGFAVDWSAHFRDRFARQPVKTVRASLDRQQWSDGELMVTGDGLEGGLIYALSGPAREAVAQQGSVTLWLDLQPDRPLDSLVARLSQPRGRRSLAKHLKDKAAIDGIKAGLLREFSSTEILADPLLLARQIKALPLPLGQPFAISKAISSAGGVCFDALTDGLMIRNLPGVFCAGEMLDWEAPTGGYLLTACFASGKTAGQGVLQWLAGSASAQ